MRETTLKILVLAKEIFVTYSFEIFNTRVFVPVLGHKLTLLLVQRIFLPEFWDFLYGVLDHLKCQLNVVLTSEIFK